VADKQESNATPTVPEVAGSHANAKGGGLTGQESGADPVIDLLTTIGIVDAGLLVIIAVPVTVQLPVGNGLLKVPEAETVAVVAVAVKVMAGGVVVVVEAPHVTVKL
jgi:hypothetical protein